MTHKFKIGIIAAIAVSAVAFTAPKTKHDAIFTVDTKATTATWLGKKVTGQHNGGINISKGSIITNHGIITGGSVEFDMNSITNTDLTDKGYNDKLVGHLKSDDFFGVAKYPTSKIDITKVTLKSGNDYMVTGNLTIKGISNEITFPAMIKMDPTTIVTIATITVDRTKYGIKYGSASFIDKIGDKAINDNFELNVNVVAKAEAGH